MKNFSKSLLLSFLIPAMTFAAAPTWKIDTSKSKIDFTATQNGSPTTGEFKKFDGEIQFDPKQLDSSSIVINVDIGSVTTSYKDIGDPLKTSDWFDTKAFPTAVFKSTKITSAGSNHYVAEGTLTIKGVTLPVKLDFVLDNYSDTAALATGSTSLMRTAYKVGTGDWSKTDTVKDPVKVDFVLAATK
jgi:polyisoprenoid-binding protein YceI